MKFFPIMIVLFAIFFSFYVNQDVFGHHVIEEIPVSESPMGMSLSNDILYVSSFGYPHIDMINLKTNENVGFITTSASGIADVVAVPDKNKIYAAPFASGGIDVYTLSTRQIIKTIPLPNSEFTIRSTSNQPYGQTSNIHFVTSGWSMDYNPTKELLYVVNYDSNLIYVIDGKKDEVIQTITVPRHPFSVKADPVTNIVMVASIAGNEITFLEDVTDEFSVMPIHEIVKTIKVTKAPWGLAIDSESGIAYVTNRGCECLTVIDILNKEVKEDIPLGDKAQSITVDQSEHQIYATYLTQNKIVKIDGTTNKIVSQETISSNPWSIEVDPTTHKVYASLKTENKVLVLGPHSKSISMPIVTMHTPIAYVGMIDIHGQDVDATSAIIDSEKYLLYLSIQSEDGGKAAISFPRSVLDSQENGTDIPFEIKIDDVKVDSTESTIGEKIRMVSVNVPKGAESIIIKGNKSIQIMPNTEKVTDSKSMEISSEKIICEGKVWVENAKGKIACVTPSTAEILVKRGWGNYLE